MTISDVFFQSYLNTLSSAEKEKFKKFSPEEQKRKIDIFMQESGIAPAKVQAKDKSDKSKSINMTGDASVVTIGDEVSFSSSAAIQAPEEQVPTYPANMDRFVKPILREIKEGKEGYYDTAQNIQITIDRIQEGSFNVNPKIKDYIVYQLEQKLKSFPPEEVARVTNMDRRIELTQSRKNNEKALSQIEATVKKIQTAVGKEYDKAGIITALGEGILGDWMDESTGRKEYAEKMSLINQRITTLMNLKNTLTTQEFKQKAQELLGDILNPDAIVSAFKAGEEANAAMGKTYVIAGTAIAVTGGMAAGALAAGGAAAGGATAAGASAAKTALTVGTVAKGAAIGAGTGAVVGGGSSIATDTIDKLTNNTDNAEDFSAEGLVQMGKNATVAAAMGAAGGAAGGAIASTLMGTTLSTGAKVGLDIAANTAVGVGLDYATTGEVTLEGTLMNFGTTALGGISAHRGSRVDINPSTRANNSTQRSHTLGFFTDTTVAQTPENVNARIAEPQTEFFGWGKKKNSAETTAPKEGHVEPKKGHIEPKKIDYVNRRNISELKFGQAVSAPESTVVLLGTNPPKAVPLSDVLGSKTLMDGETITVGADRNGGNADVKLDIDDKSISRNHFSVTRYGNNYVIKATSPNGLHLLPPIATKLSKNQSKLVPAGTILNIGQNRQLKLSTILERRPINDGESIIVGRGNNTHVQITGDSAISGQHLQITRRGDNYLITDMSSNGTTIIAPDIETSTLPQQNQVVNATPVNRSNEKLIPTKDALYMAKQFRNIKRYDNIEYLREICPHLSNEQIQRIFSLDKTQVAYIEQVQKKYPNQYITHSTWLQHQACDTNSHCAWKMHLFSDTAADYRQLADVVIPYLTKHNIGHKTIAGHVTPETLAATSPKQAGKTFTIYPQSMEEMARVAKDLDELIRAHNLTKQGSKISGDAAMGDSGRLFYRYEYTSKTYKDVILDPKDPNFRAKYERIYCDNRGGDRHLAYDMTDADDPWKNFLKPSGANISPQEPAVAAQAAGATPKKQAQIQSKSFNARHKIDRTEKIVDGYMDGGRGATFDANGNIVGSNREIIVVDRTKDRVLNWMISDIKRNTAGMTETQKINYLFNYVTQKCGGKGSTAVENNLNNWNYYNTNKQVLLGDIVNNNTPISVCRHRSLLFKVLGDEIGVNVNLQRGCFTSQSGQGGHAWNVVRTNTGDYYICDTMNNKIIPIQESYINDLKKYQSVDYRMLYIANN